jgi:hypothetical protein
LRAECEAPEGEFALAPALIEARGRAGMIQEQVAKTMGTTEKEFLTPLLADPFLRAPSAHPCVTSVHWCATGKRLSQRAFFGITAIRPPFWTKTV